MKSGQVAALLAALAVGVFAGYRLAPAPESTPAVAAKAERKPLYYRHPMNPSVTSPVPAKDEMNMDYTPVYAEDEPARDSPGALTISAEKRQKLGVASVAAEHRELHHTVRAVGVVEADEARLYNVALKFDGYIEKLYVNTTGQAVRRGQPLFDLYSPDLLTAQREFLIARHGRQMMSEGDELARTGMEQLAAASLERLRNWGIADQDLAALNRGGKVLHSLTVRAPADGVVLDKQAVAGMKASAGDVLYHIADLSRVWLIAQVYEQDIGSLALGTPAEVTLDAYPGQVFQGRIGFIYPMLDAATRTVKVRVELLNPHGLLKPMMYGHVALAGEARHVLAIPISAVLDSGRRTVVLVDLGEGRFQPRTVKLGLRGEDAVEVLEGLEHGERVVVAANFLIDAESNLKSALDGFGAGEPEPAAPAAASHAGHGAH